MLATAAPTAAQQAGREPAPGTSSQGGFTYINAERTVTASGRLRFWRAYANNGARVLLKVYRSEGNRLVLVGTSALELVPPGTLATFACDIPVSRQDYLGCYCPDANCVDRFPDGITLTIEGDVGTQELAQLHVEYGEPALFAGTTENIDVPAHASRELVIPAVARTPGYEGTFWQTSLDLFNTSNEETLLGLYFNRTRKDNTLPAATAQLTLPPRQSTTVDDVLLELFELEQDVGFVDIVATAPVIAHARVFTTTAQGSFGHTVPGLPARWATRAETSVPGANPNGPLQYLFEVSESEQWRSHLGVVNTSAVPLTLEVRAIRDNTPVGQSLRIDLAPHSHRQINRILTRCAVPSPSLGAIIMVAPEQGSSGSFLSYLSRIDNSSGDAVFLMGARESTLF